ncbi:MAG: DEAD/DEAH box helicase [Proteobacteria bacterium]|jgi:non-specific serine/threonine protein kinase|nr:DEAD/DEAH box helicase [Pseudomonadota bacterium]
MTKPKRKREAAAARTDHLGSPIPNHPTLRLTPNGNLVLAQSDDAPPLDGEAAERIERAFSLNSGNGLLHLGGSMVGRALPPVFSYWRELAVRYLTGVCTLPDVEERRDPVPPSDASLEELASAAPLMPGAEYLTADVLRALWSRIGAAFASERSARGGTVQDLLSSLSPAWNVVGRVHFHLAENRGDTAAPFAFLATYTSRLSALGKAQHQPLGQALREYAGAAEKERLLALLLPVQRASESCAWLAEMIASGEIFHPLRWSPVEAFRLLNDVPRLESAGVVVRMPAAWKGGRPPRPRATATVGASVPSSLGADALLDFNLAVTIDGARLSAREVKEILRAANGLALIRGQWVEVDGARLGRVLDRFERARALAAAGGLTFAEAMRTLVGVGIGDATLDAEDRAWAHAVAGPWLEETLRGLRSPERLTAIDPGDDLHGTLRPYQEVGLRWLHLLSRLGLGACLADDMGLGKTVQVIALLLALRREGSATRRPSLLVAPASLLANWAAELERFAPTLRAVIAHPSAKPPAALAALDEQTVAGADLVITSYGTLLRSPKLGDARWELAILDEAQAIKNPGTRQTRATKELKTRARIALTGTPVENRLGDLWSIFDFINPGLLGSARAFSGYAKRLADDPHNPYGPLRDLVRPYILRRLKTDKTVITDLPEKTELRAFCALSRKQAALYQQAVEELADALADADGIRRKGVVLASLMRLKQICNHPSQWLGDGGWAEGDSGKLGRLRELSEIVAAKQEKALVFTQFAEAAAPLAAFLGGIFGRPGVVLTGATAVKHRRELVRRFQEDENVPFFVLSLKAGGSGLNLTAAAHVIHFDRWWNPAVENQATDRAFRIGQTRNVLVHKLVCRGTVEEKIDALIESKRQLSRDLLEGGAELSLSELPDDEIMRIVALDLRAAVEE